MKKPCPIGLEDCIPRNQSSCVNSDFSNCINFFTCYAWTRPWPIPLTRIYLGKDGLDKLAWDLAWDSPYWLVQFPPLSAPINSVSVMQERNWKEYFADYGYAEAVPLHNPC